MDSGCIHNPPRLLGFFVNKGNLFGDSHSEDTCNFILAVRLVRHHQVLDVRNMEGSMEAAVLAGRKGV